MAPARTGPAPLGGRASPAGGPAWGPGSQAAGWAGSEEDRARIPRARVGQDAACRRRKGVGTLQGGLGQPPPPPVARRCSHLLKLLTAGSPCACSLLAHPARPHVPGRGGRAEVPRALSTSWPQGGLDQVEGSELLPGASFVLYPETWEHALTSGARGFRVGEDLRVRPVQDPPFTEGACETPRWGRTTRPGRGRAERPSPSTCRHTTLPQQPAPGAPAGAPRTGTSPLKKS